MTDYVVEHIKSILKSYNYHTHMLKIYEDKLLEIKTARGIHAVRYDKEMTSVAYDRYKAEMNNLNMQEKEEQWQKKVDNEKTELAKIDDILNSVHSKISEPIFNIYCLNKSTYFREAKKLGIHEKTLKRLVDRELKNYGIEKFISS